MILSVGNLQIVFPFEIIYPEQIQILYILKKIFDEEAQCIMGISQNVGLPFVVFYFFLSYQKFLKTSKKLVYWVFGEFQIHILLQEWKLLYKKFEMYQNDKKTLPVNMLVCGIFEKKNLCINYKVSSKLKFVEIEDLCQFLTSCRLLKKNDPKVYLKNLLKKKITCIFFFNKFFKNCKNHQKKIFTLIELRKEGVCKKICPFYLLSDFSKNSDIVIGNIEKFFLNDSFNIIKYQKTRGSFLIFDNIYQIDGIDTDFIFFQIGKIEIENSEKILFLFKNLIIRESLKKKEKKKFKKTIRHLKEKIILILNKIFPENTKFFFIKNQSDCFLCTSIKKRENYKKKKRLLYSVHFFQELILYIRFFFFSKNTVKQKTEQVFKTLIKGFFCTGNSIKWLQNFLKQTIELIKSIDVLEIRKYESLNKLKNFLRILFLYEESVNENFHFFFIFYKQKYGIMVESTVNLICKESSIVIRLIFEKFKSTLFFTSFFSDLKIYILLVNCKPLIYGSLKIFSSECNFLPISVVRNSRNIERCVLNFCFLFVHQVLNMIIESVLIFLPTFYWLEVFINKWKNNHILKKTTNKKSIFIETGNFVLDFSLIEDYKLSIDVGNNSFFVGFYKGILYRTNLTPKYTKMIFTIGAPCVINFYLSNLVQKSREKDWDNFISFRESDYIFNKFSTLAKNHNLFIKIFKNCKVNIKKKNFGRKTFEIFKKNYNIFTILKKIKHFFKIENIL